MKLDTKIKALKMQEQFSKQQQAEAELKQRKVLENMKNWTEKVLPTWHTNRDHKYIGQLCHKGIPPNLRGKVWPLLIGNELKVSE